MSVSIGPARLARSTAAVNVLFRLHLVFNSSESCHCVTPPTLFSVFISNITGDESPPPDLTSSSTSSSAGNGFRAGTTTAPWLLTGSGRSALKLERRTSGGQHPSKKSPCSGVGLELKMTRIAPLLLAGINFQTCYHGPFWSHSSLCAIPTPNPLLIWIIWKEIAFSSLGSYLTFDK
ncbi:hypothetical protein BDN72DRAFT_851222 [Pluteus cervinus]|uniref:Uncharacterized protein n=1 Tax=Pluteus cervinus TaxID=181527 RepID=A0ACD3A3Z9_9AGAR|nr:hypothetical protein BDN72DRAFT_851222 [Pluteus cervinus]